MKKKIEEFTGEGLYVVYDRAVGGSVEGMEAVRDYIKANLDTGVDVIGNAPERAKYFCINYYDDDYKHIGFKKDSNDSVFFPIRPTRPMNRSELVKALEGYACEFSDEDIKAMLAKRGISTEVVD